MPHFSAPVIVSCRVKLATNPLVATTGLNQSIEQRPSNREIKNKNVPRLTGENSFSNNAESIEFVFASISEAISRFLV